MGMADVLVTRVWALLVALYGADLVLAELLQSHGSPAPAGTALSGLALMAGSLVALRSARLGSGAIAAVSLIALLGPVSSTMTALVMWVSVALALLDEDEVGTGLRASVATMYAFAAANKAVGPFADGSVIAAQTELVPQPRLVALSVILIEAALAWVVLRRWRAAGALIVAFHFPVAALVADSPGHAAHLLLYGFIAASAASCAVLTGAVESDSGDRAFDEVHRPPLGRGTIS